MPITVYLTVSNLTRLADEADMVNESVSEVLNFILSDYFYDEDVSNGEC